MILITGATGANGAELTKLLSSKGVPLRAMVRTPQRAQSIAGLHGVDLVTGDFDDPPSLEAALQGVGLPSTNSSERSSARSSMPAVAPG